MARRRRARGRRTGAATVRPLLRNSTRRRARRFRRARTRPSCDDTRARTTRGRPPTGRAALVHLEGVEGETRARSRGDTPRAPPTAPARVVFPSPSSPRAPRRPPRRGEARRTSRRTRRARPSASRANAPAPLSPGRTFAPTRGHRPRSGQRLRRTRCTDSPRPRSSRTTRAERRPGERRMEACRRCDAMVGGFVIGSSSGGVVVALEELQMSRNRPRAVKSSTGTLCRTCVSIRSCHHIANFPNAARRVRFSFSRDAPRGETRRRPARRTRRAMPTAAARPASSHLGDAEGLDPIPSWARPRHRVRLTGHFPACGVIMCPGRAGLGPRRLEDVSRSRARPTDSAQAHGSFYARLERGAR